MKLNWAERMAVNNPIRPLQQRLELTLVEKRIPLKPGGNASWRSDAEEGQVLIS